MAEQRSIPSISVARTGVQARRKEISDIDGPVGNLGFLSVNHLALHATVVLMDFSIWAYSISNIQLDEAENVAFAGFEKALRLDDA